MQLIIIIKCFYNVILSRSSCKIGRYFCGFLAPDANPDVHGLLIYIYIYTLVGHQKQLAHSSSIFLLVAALVFLAINMSLSFFIKWLSLNFLLLFSGSCWFASSLIPSSPAQPSFHSPALYHWYHCSVRTSSPSTPVLSATECHRHSINYAQQDFYTLDPGM